MTHASASTTPPTARSFGQHVRSLRTARKLSRDELAERSKLSVDTIEQIESGELSPDLAALRRLAAAFDMELSTLFSSYELGELETRRELDDVLAGRSPREVEFGVGILRDAYEQLDKLRDESDD